MAPTPRPHPARPRHPILPRITGLPLRPETRPTSHPRDGRTPRPARRRAARAATRTARPPPTGTAPRPARRPRMARMALRPARHPRTLPIKRSARSSAESADRLPVTAGPARRLPAPPTPPMEAPMVQAAQRPAPAMPRAAALPVRRMTVRIVPHPHSQFQPAIGTPSGRSGIEDQGTAPGPTGVTKATMRSSRGTSAAVFVWAPRPARRAFAGFGSGRSRCGQFGNKAAKGERAIIVPALIQIHGLQKSAVPV